MKNGRNRVVVADGAVTGRTHRPGEPGDGRRVREGNGWMKRWLCALLTGLLAVCWQGALGAEVKNVTAVQRWPWNGKVDVRFEVVGELPENAMLSVRAEDGVSGNTYTASANALSGDTGRAAGVHHVVWDLDAQGVNLQSTNVVFTTSYNVALYCVVDLSNGESAASYPVTYMDAPPSGGFNTDAYKTTKLVLRRIPAGSFKMNGSYQVTLTKPFYAGLFEVTQKQWSLVMGSNPSYHKGDKRPVEMVSYNAIRGSSAGAKWPTNNAVDASSFLGKLRARTGLAFDLPTEAQWEYACRAGTTTTYSYGNSANENYMWYNGNQTHEVGTKKANPWGLYDMHGNVWEKCLDWYGSLSAGTDPKGSSSGSGRVRRGGGWYNYASSCTSSFRDYYDPPDAYDYIAGFRLVRTLPN